MLLIVYHIGLGSKSKMNHNPLSKPLIDVIFAMSCILFLFSLYLLILHPLCTISAMSSLWHDNHHRGNLKRRAQCPIDFSKHNINQKEENYEKIPKISQL